MNNKLILGVGLAQEFEHAFNRNGFASLEEIKQLAEGDFLAQVRKVMQGSHEIKLKEPVVDLSSEPKEIMGGGYPWRATRHINGVLAKLVHKEGKLYVNDRAVILQRIPKGKVSTLPEEGMLNANLLDYLLKHPYLVPDLWHHETYGADIFFMGTEYRQFCPPHIAPSGAPGHMIKIRHMIAYRGTLKWNWVTKDEVERTNGYIAMLTT
jgi:hypothetical protein